MTVTRGRPTTSPALPTQPIIASLARAVMGSPHLTTQGAAFVEGIASGGRLSPDGAERLFDIIVQVVKSEVGPRHG